VTLPPAWLTPMAATLTQERFYAPEWVYERKYDGIRMIAFKRAGKVELFSRTHNRQNDAFPRLVKAIAELPVDNLILDGEATWRETNSNAYHVFDVLWLNGEDVRAQPLDARRALLAELPFREPIIHVTALEGTEPWTRACSEGWEGVIAKRRDSPYEHRRSKSWLKMKCEVTAEFVIGGFTDPQGARAGLGALLVGMFEGSDFVYAGKVGTGFDTQLLLELRTRLNALEIDKPPFTKAVGLPRVRAHWVTPRITVQVAFMEWTVHRKLRHSRLLGVSNKEWMSG
jgi:bifunctional non-homologous end joining protein LigD